MRVQRLQVFQSPRINSVDSKPPSHIFGRESQAYTSFLLGILVSAYLGVLSDVLLIRAYCISLTLKPKSPPAFLDASKSRSFAAFRPCPTRACSLTLRNPNRLRLGIWGLQINSIFLILS